MTGNRGNFLYKNYVFGIQKILNDTFLRLRSLKATSSISTDFINQFLIFENGAEKISKNTTLFTNFRPVLKVISETWAERNEILKDVHKIDKFCGKFKNCAVGIKNYKNDFKEICDEHCAKMRSINGCGNINKYFLGFMTEYNDFTVFSARNALRYRICPQLRLIAEYFVLITKRKSIIMQDMLSTMK